MSPRLLPLLLAALLAAPALRAADPAGENILANASFDRLQPATDPWTGFDKDKIATGLTQQYPAVDDVGRLGTPSFPPSIDAADFFKKGMPDLLMVDARGYFRYYPNSGTKEAPQFSQCIVLPVGLETSLYQLQLVDVDGDGRPDAVLGDDEGRMYILHNQGGNEWPRFESPRKMEQNEADLRIGGQLWCNFVSPGYGPWRPRSTALDLILGDGTYASDNVYFLPNKGSADRPKFAERSVLIEGGGRQHLTVRPCHWYGPEKLDLLVGDRNGKVFLHRNVTGDSDEVPKFEQPGKALSVGGNASFAPWGRLAVCDLNGDAKPDLVWTDARGHVSYALNTGTVEAPKYDRAVPLATPNPPRLYAVPTTWNFRGGWEYGHAWFTAGGFFYFLHIVGADQAEASTYEPGFQMPDGAQGKHALKLDFSPPPKEVNVAYPPYVDSRGEPGVYRVYYLAGTSWSLKANVPYTIRFWAKGDGFSPATMRLHVTDRTLVKKGNAEVVRDHEVGVEKDIDLGSGWQKYEIPYTLKLDKNSTAAAQGSLGGEFSFAFTGKGTAYIADVSIRPNAK